MGKSQLVDEGLLNLRASYLKSIADDYIDARLRRVFYVKYNKSMKCWTVESDIHGRYQGFLTEESAREACEQAHKDLLLQVNTIIDGTQFPLFLGEIDVKDFKEILERIVNERKYKI